MDERHKDKCRLGDVKYRLLDRPGTKRRDPSKYEHGCLEIKESNVCRDVIFQLDPIVATCIKPSVGCSRS